MAAGGFPGLGKEGCGEGYENGKMDFRVRFVKDINLNQLSSVEIKEEALRRPVLTDCREAEAVPTGAQGEHSQSRSPSRPLETAGV